MKVCVTPSTASPERLLDRQRLPLGLFWWRDPFFKVTAIIGIALILILPRFLARPFLILGLLVMAG
ncbi:MAG: hypothetical protein ACREJK_05380, partial [Candidatus Methylomirabilales bacterium]